MPAPFPQPPWLLPWEPLRRSLTLRANLWGLQGGCLVCWGPQPVPCTHPPRDSCLSRPDGLRPPLAWRDPASSCPWAHLASSWNVAVGHLRLSLSKPAVHHRPPGGGGWKWAVLLGHWFLKQILKPEHLPMPAPCLCSGHTEAFPPPTPTPAPHREDPESGSRPGGASPHPL